MEQVLAPPHPTSIHIMQLAAATSLNRTRPSKGSFPAKAVRASRTNGGDLKILSIRLLRMQHRRSAGFLKQTN
jgi:hypothetical protein